MVLGGDVVAEVCTSTDIKMVVSRWVSIRRAVGRICVVRMIGIEGNRRLFSIIFLTLHTSSESIRVSRNWFSLV